MESLPEPVVTQKVGAMRESLCTWGSKHGRDYPWRHTRDPYRILIAEILLHRTRADQVCPVYLRFLELFPDLPSLIHAEPESVKALMAPLGLRWRTDLLLKMVREIGERYGGKIPVQREPLMALPGVGDYITSALLTFTDTSPEPIMDTNTVRVIGRVFGLKLNDSARRKKQFRQIMGQLVSGEKSRDISFAIIDLAALICHPRNPLCERCPLLSTCDCGGSRIRPESDPFINGSQ